MNTQKKAAALLLLGLTFYAGCSGVREELQKLKTEQKRLQSENQELRRKVIAAEHETAERDSELKKSQKRIEAVASDLESVRSVLSAQKIGASAETERLKKQFSEFEAERNALNKKLSERSDREQEMIAFWDLSSRVVDDKKAELERLNAFLTKYRYSPVSKLVEERRILTEDALDLSEANRVAFRSESKPMRLADFVSNAGKLKGQPLQSRVFLKIDDYYNYGYSKAQDSHVMFRAHDGPAYAFFYGARGWSGTSKLIEALATNGSNAIFTIYYRVAPHRFEDSQGQIAEIVDWTLTSTRTAQPAAR